MSESRDTLADVVSERQAFTGDRVTNLRTGKEFTAEIEPIEDIELNTELGRDAREVFLLHVSDREAADALPHKNRVSFSFRGQDFIGEVVRRKDNPANLQVEFGCAKVVPGVDS